MALVVANVWKEEEYIVGGSFLYVSLIYYTPSGMHTHTDVCVSSEERIYPIDLYKREGDTFPNIYTEYIRKKEMVRPSV